MYLQRSQIPKEKRKEILAYYLKHGRKEMRKKFPMTNQAASHLIYHDREIIEQIEEENFAKAGL
jgi:precorrin-2 methylase